MSDTSHGGSSPPPRTPATAENSSAISRDPGHTSSAWSDRGPKCVTFASVEGKPHLCVCGHDYAQHLICDMEVGCRWCNPDDSDPSVTHGKNGVPPLPAIGEVRRCAGVPPFACEAVLGPEVQGALCAHCAAHLDAIRAEEDDASEVFVDCDGCYPDRRPLSGKLCGRCRQKRIAVRAVQERLASSRVAVSTLELLIRAHYLTAEQAGLVDTALVCAVVQVDAVADLMGRHERSAFITLLRDYVDSLARVHRAIVVSDRGAP